MEVLKISYTIYLKHSNITAFSNLQLLSYSYVQAYATGSHFEKTFINSKCLAAQMGITERVLKPYYNFLKSEGIIHSDDTVYKEDFLFDNNFLMIYSDELDIIAHSCPNAFKYFVLLMKSRDYRHDVSVNGETRYGVVGHMPTSYFIEQLGVSANTISNYNKALEDAGVLYIVRAKYNGERNTNVYGRSRDKPFIDKYATFERRKDNDSYYRSMTVKYTWLCKGKKYSAEEIEEIKQFCLEYNKTAENPKDMTIFEKECD